MADHSNEIHVLEGYMADAGLEERVREVAELVRLDTWHGDEDMDT